MSVETQANTCRNLIAVLIVVAVLALLLLTAGCATVYEVERVEGTTTTKASIRTRREFADSVRVYYNRETGEFEFQSGAVSTQVSPLEQAAAGIITSLPSLLVPQAQE